MLTLIDVKFLFSWAFPRFGHPHSQNTSDLGIPCNPNPDPNPNSKGNNEKEMPISL